MKLKTIQIKNFKAVRECQIDLTDTTVLVGPNNSGKSSILQAIHFASRVIYQASEANKQSTLSLTEVEYIPSTAYKELAHRGVWGNRAGSPESRFQFIFDDGQGGDVTASIVVKSARNEGISITPQLPVRAQQIMRGKGQVFSAYIPGIAGIPLEETLLTKRHVYRKAASGDSNVVLRNILYLIHKQNLLTELKTVINSVYAGVDFDVSFDEDKDLYINSNILFDWVSPRKPLEFAGTGFLHVLQVFAYFILFRPKIVLIDEPESHLHPTFQTRLVRALQQCAEEHGAVVLISTHSPFIVRGLPLGSRTVWLRDGCVKASSSGDEIKAALGWGALDKSVLLCTEDKNIGFLEQLLMQEPHVYDKVSLVPFEGVSKLGSARLVTNLQKSLGSQHRVLVHRDRDCMDDKELKTWCAEFNNQGHDVWVTDDTELENYFCEPGYIACVLGCDASVAAAFFSDAFQANQEKLKEKFYNKRKEINKAIYEKIGGSPPIDDLWDNWADLHKISGKLFISHLRSKVKDAGYDEKLIGRMHNSVVLAPSLFQKLNSLL